MYYDGGELGQPYNILSNVHNYVLSDSITHSA